MANHTVPQMPDDLRAAVCEFLVHAIKTNHVGFLKGLRGTDHVLLSVPIWAATELAEMVGLMPDDIARGCDAPIPVDKTLASPPTEEADHA